MQKRYVLCPGLVRSQTDSELHFIGTTKLLRLYGVRLAECYVYTPRMAQHYEGLIFLGPRYDGKYSLPEPRR